MFLQELNGDDSQRRETYGIGARDDHLITKYNKKHKRKEKKQDRAKTKLMCYIK